LQDRISWVKDYLRDNLKNEKGAQQETYIVLEIVIIAGLFISLIWQTCTERLVHSAEGVVAIQTSDISQKQASDFDIPIIFALETLDTGT